MPAFKASKPNRDALFTDTKRKEKDSKFSFAKHMVQGDMNIVVRVFNAIFRDNKSNDGVIKRVSNRREGREETSKTTLNGININQGEMIFKFTSDVRGNNRFRCNHTVKDKGNNFLMRFRKRKNRSNRSKK